MGSISVLEVAAVQQAPVNDLFTNHYSARDGISSARERGVGGGREEQSSMRCHTDDDSL